METIKVGIVGCGVISGIYMENLTHLFLDMEIVACCDIIRERAEKRAEEFGIPNVLTNEEIYARPDIDIIVNLTYPKSHYVVCRDALLAGKHVYVEKPLSLTIEQGKELVDIAKEKGLMLGGAPETFLGAGLQACRKILDDGWIGKPIAASAFMMGHGPESWHQDPEFFYEKGGGPMFDMGPYYLTALVSLLGPVGRICGMTKKGFEERMITSSSKYGKRIPVEIPTHIAGNMEFKNGVVATLITSFDVWKSKLPRIEIYGTQGTMLVPDPNTFGGPVMVYRPEVSSKDGNDFREYPLFSPYYQNSRGIGVADMAQAIREGGRKHRANCEMTYHVLECMHGFHISSDTSRYYKMKSRCARPEPLPYNLLKGYVVSDGRK